MKACRKCRIINHDKNNPRCERCNSTDLSEDFSGVVFIIDPEHSDIAKHMNIDSPGEYALRIR
jgi:DNA-directed RNA polymerase subunit E"